MNFKLSYEVIGFISGKAVFAGWNGNDINA